MPENLRGGFFLTHTVYIYDYNVINSLYFTVQTMYLQCTGPVSNLAALNADS